MRGLYSHPREYRNIFLRDHSPHISQINEGIHSGANTCRACIRTRANTGKNPGELFMYWFRARGCFTMFRVILSTAGSFGLLTSANFRTRSTTTRDRNLQFWGAVSTGFFEFSPLDAFPFSPGLLCNLARKRLQNVEKIARFPGGEESVESCHVCGCHGVFGPDCSFFLISRLSGSYLRRSAPFQPPLQHSRHSDA